MEIQTGPGSSKESQGIDKKEIRVNNPELCFTPAVVLARTVLARIDAVNPRSSRKFNFAEIVGGTLLSKEAS